MKLFVCAAMAAFLALPSLATADSVKVGMLMGFTGPIESLAPGMARAAMIAIDEINASGLFIGGKKLVGVTADTACIDASAAIAAAERLINDEGVAAVNCD